MGLHPRECERVWIPASVALAAFLFAGCASKAPMPVKEVGIPGLTERFPGAYRLLMEDIDDNVASVKLTVATKEGVQTYVCKDSSKIHAFMNKALNRSSHRATPTIQDGDVEVTLKDKSHTENPPLRFRTDAKAALDPRFGFRRVVG